MRFAILMLLCTTPAVAQPKKDSPSATEKKAESDYEAALAEAAANYNSAVVKAHKRLANAFEEELKAATKAGDFDRAIRIRERQKQVAESGAPTLAMGGEMKFPVGTWAVKYSNGFIGTLEIGTNGEVHFVEEKSRQKLIPFNGHFEMRLANNRCQRIHVLGDALLIELFEKTAMPPVLPHRGPKAPDLVGHGSRK